MKTLAVSLALGDIYSEAGVGPLKKPFDGAIARFNALAAKVSCDSNTLMVCAAGYSRHFPLVPQPERQVSLAEQLKRYAEEHESKWIPHLVAEPMGWSTRNEIRIAIKIAQNTGFINKEEEAVVAIVSNLSHLFRIWMYAVLYTPKNWKVKLVRAHHKFKLIDHMLEPAKVVRDVLYILRVTRRLRSIKKK